jgi:hypothetical protein
LLPTNKPNEKKIKNFIFPFLSRWAKSVKFPENGAFVIFGRNPRRKLWVQKNILKFRTESSELIGCTISRPVLLVGIL